MPLTVAIGYAELGMWVEAWEALENASLDDRLSTEALALRLLCCSGLQRWAMGAHLAGLLSKGSDEDREAAARFNHSLARHEMAEGNPDFAKDAVRKAVSAWPGIKLEILNDPALERVW